MNFFKSVFSTDPDTSDSSLEEKSPSGSPHKLREDEIPTVTGGSPEHSQNPNRKTNRPWVDLGSFIKTIASKSESAIQTYRRDLEEFGSELKKETAAIRDMAARAVLDLPSSLETGASVAQESLESVGQAIDDFGGSVWRGTAEIISEGKDALLASDSDAETHSFDLQTPPLTGVNASASKRYSRFEAQVLALQSDPGTFSEEPEDAEDFLKWMSELKLEDKEEDIEILCYDNESLEALFEKLVPSVMDYDTFWTRYFYKLYKLKQAEDVRANLVKRVISREDVEEDLTWEVDDEEGKEEDAKREKDGEEERIEKIKDEPKAEIEKIKDEPKAEIEKIQNEPVDDMKEERVIAETIELEQQKKPNWVSDDLSLEVTAVIDNELVTPSVTANDSESASNEPIANLGREVFPEAKSVNVESCKDSENSILSSHKSIAEEELGWDEIEDLGELDDKKVSEPISTVSKENLHKRLSVAEEDEDLTWDIEDDE